MEENQVPHQAPQPNPSQPNFIPERFIAPIAIGLGILLIVGGILLGISKNKQEVADLPEYSPTYVTPETKGSPSPTPTSSANPTPSDSQTSDQTKIVTQPATSPYQVAKRPTKGQARGVTENKKIAQGIPVAPIPSSLPDYQPNQLADFQTTSQLSNFQPIVGLSDFTPQVIPPSPSPSPVVETVRVTLAAAGKTYQIGVKKGATVLEVLENLKSQGLSYQTQDFSFGKLVIEINGIHQSDGHFWTYTVNGVMVSKGVSIQTVEEGDVIVWTLS